MSDLRKLIVSDLQAAIREMIPSYPGAEILQAKYRSLEREWNMGIVEEDDFFKALDKIRQSALQLLPPEQPAEAQLEDGSILTSGDVFTDRFFEEVMAAHNAEASGRLEEMQGELANMEMYADEQREGKLKAQKDLEDFKKEQAPKLELLQKIKALPKDHPLRIRAAELFNEIKKL